MLFTDFDSFQLIRKLQIPLKLIKTARNSTKRRNKEILRSKLLRCKTKFKRISLSC